MQTTSRYTERIKALAPAHDPRHIEAYMRVGCGTLDGLADWQFRDEVSIAKQCIAVEGPLFAESIAKSYGL